MSDDETPKPPIVSEVVPGQPGEVSAIGSASAPFIYSDWIGSHGIGIRGGVANITLEACRNMLVGGTTISDRVVVAHLRFPFGALCSLKESITAIENMLKDAAEREAKAVKH